VNFTDKSAGYPTSWEWDFDNDGTVDSYNQNSRWTYSRPGWYTVKLTVSDGTSSDICVKEKYILVASGTYYVDGANGDDTNSGTSWSNAFRTVWKALDVAGDYDLVLVADATYNETNLNFDGKKIYLKGVDHNSAGAQPVIDCQSNGRAFYFGSRETKDSVIDNFVIQNGKVVDTGGGAILCENNSSPTITNCIFKNNEAVDTNSSSDNENGGAIYCNSSSPSIVNCTFSSNYACLYGGAVGSWNSSSPSITNCAFSDNSAVNFGGAIYCDFSSPTLTNCIFNGNRCSFGFGGAICCNYYCSPALTNCTFSGNSAAGGGALLCVLASSPTLNNCILWSNSAVVDGKDIYIKDSSSSCTLNYCCVDNTGYGFASGVPTTAIDDSNNCIFAEPQFVDAANGDYHLKDTSPCIDAGDNSLVPSGVNKDLDGNDRVVDGDNNGTATVDIGAFEYQP
ncbi:MAG: hypothetical protein DRP63_06830, partial [Planctomycetota bacterium]